MTFSRRVPDLTSANELSERAASRRRARATVLDLTETNPTQVGLSRDGERVLRALSDPAVLRYDPDPRGMTTARESVARYYAQTGLEAAPEEIILTTGTSEAYGYLFKLLCDPGDRVLVPRPSYPLFSHLASLEGVEADTYPSTWVPGAGWRLDREALASVFTKKTRAMILVHPNNPTGVYLAEEELATMSSLCAQRGAALIADEVFFDYPSPGSAPGRRRAGSFGEGLTFSLSGLSKVAALPQLKLGWIRVGGAEREAREALARLEFLADAYLSVSAGVQVALPGLLEGRAAVQAMIQERLERNEGIALQASKEVPALGLRARDGGWYLVLELPPEAADEAFAVELLEADGVLVHPGYFYDFEEEHLLVVSLLPPVETFREGMHRLAARVALLT